MDQKNGEGEEVGNHQALLQHLPQDAGELHPVRTAGPAGECPGGPRPLPRAYPPQIAHQKGNHLLLEIR